jgi:hypothetical protein
VRACLASRPSSSFVRTATPTPATTAPAGSFFRHPSLVRRQGSPGGARQHRRRASQPERRWGESRAPLSLSLSHHRSSSSSQKRRRKGVLGRRNESLSLCQEQGPPTSDRRPDSRWARRAASNAPLPSAAGGVAAVRGGGAAAQESEERETGTTPLALSLARVPGALAPIPRPPHATGATLSTGSILTSCALRANVSRCLTGSTRLRVWKCWVLVSRVDWRTKRLRVSMRRVGQRVLVSRRVCEVREREEGERSCACATSRSLSLSLSPLNSFVSRAQSPSAVTLSRATWPVAIKTK